jgi:toxin YoeB
MNIQFTPDGWDDFTSWMQDDPEIFNKINAMINEITRTPFKGTGKPEPLKGNLKGYWSRRINQEHRLVYSVQGKGSEQVLTIIQAKFHY